MESEATCVALDQAVRRVGQGVLSAQSEGLVTISILRKGQDSICIFCKFHETVIRVKVNKIRGVYCFQKKKRKRKRKRKKTTRSPQ